MGAAAALGRTAVEPITETVSAGQSPVGLHGVDGPGFTITFTYSDNNQTVNFLNPGTYRITIDDLSNIHDFHLTGAGTDVATDVAAVGTTVWNVTLQPGTYTFVCDPHASTMNGQLLVLPFGTVTSFRRRRRSRSTTRRSASPAVPPLPAKIGTPAAEDGYPHRSGCRAASRTVDCEHTSRRMRRGDAPDVLREDDARQRARAGAASPERVCPEAGSGSGGAARAGARAAPPVHGARQRGARPPRRSTAGRRSAGAVCWPRSAARS